MNVVTWSVGRFVLFTCLAAAGGALLSSLGLALGRPVDPAVGAYAGAGLYFLRFALV